MITALKEILIYNKSAALNLNTLNADIKSKIDKIFRINSITGSSYQIWSPSAGVLQFGGLVCDGIYIIESNSTNFNLSNDNSSDGLVKLNSYDKNICAGLTPTPTPTPASTASLALTPTPTPTHQVIATTPTPTITLVYDTTIVPPLIDVNGGATVTIFNLNDSTQSITIEREYLSNPGIWSSVGSWSVSANNTITASLGNAGLASNFRARVSGQPGSSDTYNYATGNISLPTVNGGSSNPTLTILNPNSQAMYAQIHYKLASSAPGDPWLDHDINVYIQPNTLYTYPTNNTSWKYRARLYSPSTGTFVSAWGYSP